MSYGPRRVAGRIRRRTWPTGPRAQARSVTSDGADPGWRAGSPTALAAWRRSGARGGPAAGSKAPTKGSAEPETRGPHATTAAEGLAARETARRLCGRRQRPEGLHGPPRRYLQKHGGASDHHAAPESPRAGGVTTTPVSRHRGAQTAPRPRTALSRRPPVLPDLENHVGYAGWIAEAGEEGSDTDKVPATGGEDHGRDGLGRRARGGRRAAAAPRGGKARRKAADGPTMCRLTCANVAERPRNYGILSRELPPLCAPRTRLFHHRRAVVLLLALCPF
jgi:hypothetical protein